MSRVTYHVITCGITVSGWRDFRLSRSRHSPPTLRPALNHKPLRAMDKFAPNASDRSSEMSANSRFTSQAATAEDLLKAHTVGLVNLNDYRKRRAEALDRKERGDSTVSSGASTPLDGY